MPDPSFAGTLVDRLWRSGYRFAYALQRLYWFVARPEAQGVYVAVWCRRRLLVVETSYKPVPTIPSGGLGRGERHAVGAARELSEEVGIDVDPDALRFVGEVRGPSKYLKDHCHIFEIDFEEEPQPTIDRREIVAAGFQSPEALLAGPLSPVVRAYLTELPAGRARMGAASTGAAR
jgi:8-oxo-dGTP pyrophosphatase MutT (NUDIX family)